jgi:two-component system cell cycle response regulator
MATTVWWKVRNIGPEIACAARLLESDFLVVPVAERPEVAPPDALRVVSPTAFAERASFTIDYFDDDRPTLLLVDSIDEELWVLDIVRPFDEIGRSTDPAELVVKRLTLLQARYLAGHSAAHERDALTGLANRRVLQAALDAAVQEATGHQAFLIFDLDNFKQVNDRYGHTFGDALLSLVAERLIGSQRGSALVARVGGDEFACLFSATDAHTLESEASRIRAAVCDAEYSIEKIVIRMTASAGMCVLEPGVDSRSVLERANEAMYEAKARRSSSIVPFRQLEEATRADDEEVPMRHFTNVTKVVANRNATMLSLMSRRLMNSARQEANEDALTGLPNRRYFDARLQREIERVTNTGEALTIAMIDLDHFGSINKTFGYPTGDKSLKAFAAVARREIRSTDWIARYGGEEFCVVLPGAAKPTGVEVAERVRVGIEVEQIMSSDQRRIPLTVSIGVIERKPGQSMTDLLEEVSKATNDAKHRGRNRVVAGP